MTDDELLQKHSKALFRLLKRLQDAAVAKGESGAMDFDTNEGVVEVVRSESGLMTIRMIYTE